MLMDRPYKLETSFKTITIRLNIYLKDLEDALLQLVREPDRKKLFFFQKDAQKLTEDLNLLNLDKTMDEPATKFAKTKRVNQKALHQAKDFIEKQWKDEAHHVKYPNRVREVDVGHQKTNQWLNRRLDNCSPRPESLASQSYHARIIKDNTEPLCRRCNKFFFFF